MAEIVDDEINESIAQHRARLDRLTSAISTRLLHEILQSEVASIGNCVAREEITKRCGSSLDVANQTYLNFLAV